MYGAATSGVGRVSGGVGVSKLSKLLNQEDALSAPCLHGDFCSPEAPHGAGDSAERLSQPI